MKRVFILLFVTLVFTFACSLGGGSSHDYESAVKDMLLMTAIAENEVNIEKGVNGLTILGKATLPIWDSTFFPNNELDVSDLTSLGSYKSGTLTNYPEQGQTTTYKVSNTGNNVYLVETETRYGQKSNREVTYEDYYLKDVDGYGKLTTADPACTASGA
ncbi:MAG: hypothetical protein SNJ78_11640, partial [Spirochaetales bacterium]